MDQILHPLLERLSRFVEVLHRRGTPVGDPFQLFGGFFQGQIHVASVLQVVPEKNVFSCARGLRYRGFDAFISSSSFKSVE
ncbi:MAG TPA: hypothetical protein VF504_06415, partial [Solirubrobacterales bacterium]